MAKRENEEYRALRATIRTRGTARVWSFLAGLTAWAGLLLGAAVTGSVPATTLIPLVVLAGTFEAVMALHVGVERIGRYLQVFHEDRWEQTAMSFGAPLAGTGSDPLFSALFGLATVLNFLPVLAADAVPVELAVIGSGHALFLGRVFVARRAAERQRAADFDRFQQLKRPS